MGGEDGTLLLRKRSKHTPPAIKQVKYARPSSWGISVWSLLHCTVYPYSLTQELPGHDELRFWCWICT